MFTNLTNQYTLISSTGHQPFERQFTDMSFYWYTLALNLIMNVLYIVMIETCTTQFLLSIVILLIFFEHMWPALAKQGTSWGGGTSFFFIQHNHLGQGILEAMELPFSYKGLTLTIPAWMHFMNDSVFC